VKNWTAKADERERKRATHRQFLAELLPFSEQEAFTFLDLGAGTGAAARGILSAYPHSTAILADFSAQMMGRPSGRCSPSPGATPTSNST